MLEEIIRERLQEIWNKARMSLSKEKKDAYMREAKTKAGQKLLKLAIDLDNVDCDFNVMGGGEFMNFYCSMLFLPQSIILKPSDNGEKVEIVIYSADEELAGADLKYIDYKIKPYDIDRWKAGKRVDYFKVLDVDDLERELLRYINRLETHINDKTNLYKRTEQEIELLKEYLEEEILK